MVLAFFLEIFIRHRFGIRKDALRSSMYEFVVGQGFRVFELSMQTLKTKQKNKLKSLTGKALQYV